MDTALVFGIIFAAIVITLLLFFGFDYINKLFSISCESQIGQQMTNLKNVVKSTLTLSKDSSQTIKMLVPSCVQKVCFVDSEHPDLDNEEWGWTSNPFLINMVSSYGYNFIIFRNDGSIDGYAIEKFKPYVNFCLEASRDVTIRNIGTIAEATLPEF
jgi:hypothetical protein